MSTLGVIAAGSEASVAAGAEILRTGGNAVDAAVAATFATAGGDASITSLAGGGVLIFREAATGCVEVCDFFVSAPGLGGRRHARGPRATGLEPLDFRAVEIHFGVGNTTQKFHVGRGAAAVPGIVPGLAAALERWGTLSLSKAIAPAARFLHEGMLVTEYHHSCFRILEPILKQSDCGRRLFFDEHGKLLVPGAIFRNPQLADTLSRLGHDGLQKVYHNEIAALMLEEFGEERGGWFTPDDLRAWRPDICPALQVRYGDTVVATNPSPAVGGRYLLHTLDLFQRAEIARHSPSSRERYHRMAAVFRAVSEARSKDPELVEQPEASKILAERLGRILNGSNAGSRDREPRSPGNTTHVSVIDRDGNAAGITISHGEGCGHWIGDTGLHMNNMLGEEDLFPAGFHQFTPGERLKTMMAPTVISLPSGALAVLGSGGSNRIRTAMAQVVSALTDDHADVETAVSRGRLHFEGGVLSAETYALPGGASVLEHARVLAHEIKEFDAPSLFFGGVHVAYRSADGTLTGYGDSRRGGVALVVES